tara:strand:- start:3030 stop:3734 length:705 start_codon:yes stop_codon:yes gene_type:complete
MNIAIIGYGQMGKEIEKISISRDHVIGKIIDLNTENKDLSDCDVAILFTTPDSAIQNIKLCLDYKVPVVCGTTGWLEKYDHITDYCKRKDATFLFSPNFSIGVNLFFKLNSFFAEKMSKSKNFNVSVHEKHHLKKIDNPSGTAIKIAEDILSNYSFSGWSLKDEKNKLKIYSDRVGNEKGFHEVLYESEHDSISISHNAKSRKGFALGAVLCAEWIFDKKGVFTMDDFLNNINF